jgi:alkanesulfonate monooxygenase SsuD/methylene tetrahydromethanopterin reductase-like flavin-dependent oxidoreductase (luciferase family)
VQSTSPAPGASGSSIPDFYSRLVDPFVALARASAVMTTLKLGTGVGCHRAEVMKSFGEG